ncbi:MAG: histidine phosphotransferase family protein [Pseudomonadota bacterium]
MPSAAIDLPALLGSRICHDLISPLGAIGNGVELLHMSGSTVGPEVALISESIENANARIRFFRIAFGSSAPGQTVGRNEINGILNDMLQGSRLKITWSPDGDLPRGDVKLIFLLLMCLETSLPYGGRIDVTLSEGAWRLSATADKVRLDPAIWALAAGGGAETEITPALVHFALVAPSLTSQNRTLSTDLTDQRIDLRV